MGSDEHDNDLNEALASVSPLVSIVVPAYNEGEFLPPFLSQLGELIRSLGKSIPTIEYIIIDDGSHDDHRQKHQATVEHFSALLSQAQNGHRVIFKVNSKNRGKASTIRYGWTFSHPAAEWLGFHDADGAFCAEECLRLVQNLPEATCDVLAGSRIRMAGYTVNRSVFRHLQGRVFATLVEHLFKLGFYDTQCGIKFFRSSSLRPYLPLLRENGWLLDIEILALLNQHGARLCEIPINCFNIGKTKIKFASSHLQMLLSLFALKQRLSNLGE